jgi:hypothetical protein
MIQKPFSNEKKYIYIFKFFFETKKLKKVGCVIYPVVGGASERQERSVLSSKLYSSSESQPAYLVV